MDRLKMFYFASMYLVLYPKKVQRKSGLFLPTLGSVEWLGAQNLLRHTGNPGSHPIPWTWLEQPVGPKCPDFFWKKQINLSYKLMTSVAGSLQSKLSSAAGVVVASVQDVHSYAGTSNSCTLINAAKMIQVVKVHQAHNNSGTFAFWGQRWRSSYPNSSPKIPHHILFCRLSWVGHRTPIYHTQTTSWIGKIRVPARTSQPPLKMISRKPFTVGPVINDLRNCLCQKDFGILMTNSRNTL